ncbi:hypothetical protein [Halovivax gelatinilyticus]|uniref:hypothetical protein n=1 Tax=Halovivax gelatinilyticus TaxID=2961597 RepID=UPI0020CA8729|nr:hypothetical protein [Halovivax gelatinilyticus]
MNDDPLEPLRRRTLLGGTLLWFVLAGGSAFVLYTEGLSVSVLAAFALSLAAGIALFSVHRSGTVTLVDVDLDPFRRAGLGYGLLALATGIAYAPHVALEFNALTPVVWALVLVALAHQEWTGPHESIEPTMKQVATIVVLTMVAVIGLPVALFHLA